VFVPVQFFSSGQLSNQLAWFMDQDWEVLRANPITLLLVFQSQQWNFLAALFADNTSMVIACHG
jgi:hypothetical protein